MPTLTEIRRTLATHTPRLITDPEKRHAAVALLLNEYQGKSRLLFIERAAHEGDPWSGHIAFPGGKIDPCDPEPRSAAERETLEELGLDLNQAEYLGRLDDVTGSTLPVLVSGFVYCINSSGPFTLNYEVRDTFWISLNALTDTSCHIQHKFHFSGTKRTLPAIDLFGPGHPVLWGLTYRFVSHFLDLLNRPIPPMPSRPENPS
ncbi:MAG: CoA pyrophosphatase [bacterium]|nr:CoA pyrophosphatase [bacterium]